MAQIYTVQQGDHLSSIAAKFGFADFRTIWNHPNNATLKNQRKDPHVLLPGDTIHIPDRQEKTEKAPTTKVSRFVVQSQKLTLRLVVKDFDDRPIADTACELEIDGVVYPLRTDGKGLLEKEIPRTAQGGTLRIPELDLEIPVKIGHLDPLDEDTGWRARLINLGYHAGPIDSRDPVSLRYAIEEFQCDQKLKVTGVMDAATRARLKQMHGG